jgi:hypothetical protein
VRRRLQLRYGQEAHFALRNDAEGAVAEVQIPLRKFAVDRPLRERAESL